MRNTINTITLSDYSEYDEDKCRYDGAYGYDNIYAYDCDNDSFSYEWTTTSELIPNNGPSDDEYLLTEVFEHMADFISRNANTPNCTVYVNGIVIWKSTPIDSHDIDESGLYLDE